MAHDPYALKIHIDGSAYRNPGGVGGIAAIVEYPDTSDKEPETAFQIGFTETTNQRMELRACIEALKWARDHEDHLQLQHLIIITDSKYVYENQFRAPLWKRLKWRNQEGRPVDNSDLWDDLLKARTKTGVRTDIEWRKGKATQIEKDVDRKAKESARMEYRIRDCGFQSGKVGRSRLRGTSSSLFPANGQVEIVRIYRKGSSYGGPSQESKVFFEVYSQTEKTYVSKHHAYTSLRIESEVHRGHLYKVRFNDNPKYPILEEIIEEFVPD